MSKPTKRGVQKRRASQDEIINLARKYNDLYPLDTPDDVYQRRNEVHEAMAKFSNALEIYDALRTYDASLYNVSTLSGFTLIPWIGDIFPGYVAITDEDGNVLGYLKKAKDLLIPLGAIAVSDLNSYDPNTLEMYAPDFVNSYLYYVYPELLYPTIETAQQQAVEPIEEFIGESEEPYKIPQLSELPIETTEKVKNEDLVSTELFDSVQFSPSAKYFNPRVNGSLKVNMPILQSVNPALEDSILTIEEYTQPINPKYPFDDKPIGKDPYHKLRRLNDTSRHKIEDSDKDLKLIDMENDLYNGLGIYWDKDLGTWRFNSSYYYDDQFGSPRIGLFGLTVQPFLYSGNKYPSPSEDILFGLGESINDYNSIYRLYERLLRYLQYPYMRIQ